MRRKKKAPEPLGSVHVFVLIYMISPCVVLTLLLIGWCKELVLHSQATVEITQRNSH